jgi:hypothetical protein
MRPFDRELPVLERSSAPSIAPLRQVGGFAAALADLDRLGKPDFEDPEVEEWFSKYGLPPGPQRQWWLRAGCGLEFVLSQDFYTEVVAVLAEEVAEFDHVLAHLPFSVEQSFQLAPYRDEETRRRGCGGWVLLRMDEHGNRFDITSLSRERSARCLAERLQARGHKQTYLVEPRGQLPPPPTAEPGPARWVLVRQDEHGVRYEVRRSPYRSQLAFLAEHFNLEPRHKQMWFVEPVSEAPSGD